MKGLMIAVIVVSIITTLYYVPYGIEMALRVIIGIFCKPKKYKESDKKNKFAMIIPCRNEESVIANTIKQCKKIKYPKDKFEIIVAAHNCTDKTAEVAQKENVEVWVFNEDNPKHKRKGYIMRYIFNRLNNEKRDYDAIVFLDADNIPEENYLNKMNDAYSAGSKVARPYFMPSTLSKSSTAFSGGIFIFFMSRIQGVAKALMKTNPTITGSSYMFSMDVIKNIEWDFFSLAEDVEVTTKLTLEGYSVDYVHDAVVYESVNPTIKDNWYRHSRLANGCLSVFFKNKFKVLLKFFKYWKFKYLSESINISELVMASFTLLWTPISLIITYFFFKEKQGNEIALKIVLSILVPLICFFFLGMYLLAIVILLKEKNRIKEYSMEKITKWQKIKAVLFMPIFAMIISLASIYGMMAPQKWKIQKRVILNNKNNK